MNTLWAVPRLISSLPLSLNGAMVKSSNLSKMSDELLLQQRQKPIKICIGGMPGGSSVPTSTEDWLTCAGAVSRVDVLEGSRQIFASQHFVS